jgi:class 3 adenylate cyclase
MKSLGRVLVVDDIATNRSLLAARLKTESFAVEEAENGADALARLRNEPFDLVFLDLMMPGMTGYEVLAEIKADPDLRELPVLMLSAIDDTDAIVRCLELGAEDYLSKPFDPLILRARVGASLARKRLRDQEARHFKEIEAERDRSEELLLNILPRSIADRLKEHPSIIAETFPEASILFADIVGFTELASRLPAETLVGLLNDIFSEFDALVDRHGMEKIKTIGDAYLAAAGVPLPHEDHAMAAAEMALDMLDAMSRFNSRAKTDFSIRIGLNSGPVVAGVIGKRKFIFDLWGDAVNVASRMESHGTPGRIQTTDACRELLGGRYEFTERGEIQIKGKGGMRTWYLDRRRFLPGR